MNEQGTKRSKSLSAGVATHAAGRRPTVGGVHPFLVARQEGAESANVGTCRTPSNLGKRIACSCVAYLLAFTWP